MFTKVWLPVLVAVLSASPAVAQSQAINGTIEGTITDESGAVLPGVTVTVTNLDTGVSRSVLTNDAGVYRAPLLPLGTYRVAAELTGFKAFEQAGIVLTAGEAAVVNIRLGVGTVSEVISVTGDSSVVDLGRIDQGRTLNEREIKNLPLTSRNPYNFALLQPGVTGFETQEFGVPRLTANGALLRVNYQIDGNNNTQKDRAGLRQMPMSEVMIREVKVITTGYAPEFGQTMGLVYNAITPSGTNTMKGQASYRFQRKAFAAKPFFVATTAAKPPTDVDLFTADLGGPIVRDRMQYFAGFENTNRDLSGGRVITISAADAAALGLTEPPYMPAALDTKFGIGKVDATLNASNHLTARYIYFDNFIVNNIGGGLNSVQRGTDFSDRQHSTAAQLVSTVGSSLLNELRVQYATRRQGRVPGSQAGTGPGITVSSVANFGGPIAGNADAGFAFTQNVFEVIDNFTLLRANHSYKFGFDIQHVADTRTQTQFQLYTFPNVTAYNAARVGTTPRSYTSFQQFFGNPDLEYSSNLYSVFVQDDWRLNSRVKLLYGVRYDVYDVPDGVAAAPLESSRDFTIDTNNWQPRVGVVWTLDEAGRTVVRANTGLMYDQPLLAAYETALLQDGSALRTTVTLTPTSAGAPAFPTTLENTPPGFVRPLGDASTVDPAFRIASAWQTNVQAERALDDRYAVSAGFSYVRGRDLPVITNVNLINPTGTLADGRPIFSTAVSAATRLDPRFRNILAVQSVGESTYRALTLQLTRRFSDGIQLDFAYTLAKSEDNAPITTVLSVQGDQGRIDPTSLDRDLGPNILDQRHTFVGSIVAQPSVEVSNDVLRAILNQNQFGVAMLFASGIPVNVRANRELNNDGNSNSDRPLDVPRNSLNLPARYNVDLRASRIIPIHGNVRAEVIAELKNVFNSVQWASVNSVVATDTAGAPVAPIPVSGDGLPPTGGYEQRQFQLGFKVYF
jgi:Carboxypeptidase regulatory-like domain/TonB dependent receptor